MLTTILAQAEATARRAGALLREHYARPVSALAYKSSAIDPVTETDKAAEALIVEAILGAFPDHHIVGEEGGGYGAAFEAAPYRWYVDPLDGTVNFAHRVPLFSVSLSVTDQTGEPVAGVVYHPLLDECFTATRGGGTFLNGEPVRVSATGEMLHALVVTGFPYDRHTNDDDNMREWLAMMKRTQGARRMGSAALDLAYVACGRFDAYWEQRLHPWDVLGGILMVREAGGKATNFWGGPEGLYEAQTVLASNGHIHGAMVEVLAATRAAVLMA